MTYEELLNNGTQSHVGAWKGKNGEHTVSQIDIPGHVIGVSEEEVDRFIEKFELIPESVFTDGTFYGHPSFYEDQ